MRKFDGRDEIILSEVFNIYENQLEIRDVLGFNFKFVFEEEAASLDTDKASKDVSIKSEGKDAVITFSPKFRNVLGTGTSNKIPVITFTDGKILLYSVYGSKVGDNISTLNVCVNFYLRQP